MFNDERLAVSGERFRATKLLFVQLRCFSYNEVAFRARFACLSYTLCVFFVAAPLPSFIIKKNNIYEKGK